MITAAQIRAARALLRWTGQEAARASGVSLPTVKRLELTDGVPPSRSQTLLDLQRAFETAGVEFIGSPDDRPGVRLVQPAKPELAEKSAKAVAKEPRR